MTGFDLSAAQRQARSLEHLGHRGWPIPARGWTMGQTWEDLLFAHWRVPEEVVRPHVPAGLDVDTHAGSAWIGVTPFRLTNFRLRGTLPVPGLNSFLELNVRTYVTTEDKPGIWFFSLDASSQLAVELARRTYKLPYFRARMTFNRRGDTIDYECARVDEAGRVFSGSYRPTGAVTPSVAGSLESFLSERYCLYATDERDVLHRAEIHHEPWPLQTAEADIDLVSIVPVELPADAPLCHFSRRLDVLIWPLEPVGAIDT